MKFLHVQNASCSATLGDRTVLYSSSLGRCNMTSHKPAARQRILEAASELFYQEGIRSVGVDTIVEKSGVGKATLYRHFPTKDDLISAYLLELDHLKWKHFDAVISKQEGVAKDRLHAMIDAIIDSFMVPGYRGCAFLIALAEFSDTEHPAHRLAVENNHELRVRLSKLCAEAGAKDDVLADQLQIAINGALASVPILGPERLAVQLKSIANHLIDLHL